MIIHLRGMSRRSRGQELNSGKRSKGDLGQRLTSGVRKSRRDLGQELTSGRRRSKGDRGQKLTSGERKS